MTPLDVQIAKDMLSIGLLAPVILAALKPYLTRLPIAAPTSPDRDLVLNTTLYLINLLLLIGMLVEQDMFDPRFMLTILVGAAGQHVVSALSYRAIKATVPAVQAAKAKANDVKSQPAPDGAMYTSNFTLPAQLPPDVTMEDQTPQPAPAS